MSGCLELNGKRELAAPDGGQQFLARLDRALGPAMLLRLEAVHVHRQLRRRHNVCQINEFPSCQLSAITQIQIFAQGVRLPASTLLDAGSAPKTGCPIEIEKAAAAAACGLLQQKMAVQKNR